MRCREDTGERGSDAVELEAECCYLFTRGYHLFFMGFYGDSMGY